MNRVIYTKYSNNRKNKYSICTQLCEEESGRLFVRKRPMGHEAETHVRHVYEVSQDLSKEYANSVFMIPKSWMNHNEVCMEYIGGITFESYLDEHLHEGRVEEVVHSIKEFIEEIQKVVHQVKFEKTKSFIEVFGDVELPEGLLAGEFVDIDLIFSNIILTQNNEKYIIDFEWTFGFPVPFRFVVYRCIRCYIQSGKKFNNYNLEKLYEVCGISEEEKLVYEQMENHFQREVYQEERSLDALYGYMHGPVHRVTSETIQHGMNEIETLTMQLRQHIDLIGNLNNQILELNECVKDSNNQILKLNGQIEDLSKRNQEDQNAICRQQQEIVSQHRRNLKLERKLQDMTSFAERLQAQLVGIKGTRTWRYRQKVMALLGRHDMFEEQPRTRERIEREIRFDALPMVEDTDKKIGVHLHLYYRDLLEEMLSYIDNIPYQFDLFVSCQQGEDIKEVAQITKNRLEFVRNITIEECENHGRDIAPFYVQFGQRMKEYDYIVHIHTKKSFHTGGENVDWRKYSLASILGSRGNVKRIVSLLSDDRIGLVYPELFEELTRYDLTWLSNQDYGIRILEKYGINEPFKIFQYPSGSFFWAKTDAIRPLLEHEYKLSDFEEEAGQINDTLAHVLERAVTFVALKQGYVGGIIDLEENAARYRISRKNFWDYEQLDADKVMGTTVLYDNVSFDFIGTLFATKFYRESDLYRYMMEQLPELPEDFCDKRRQAQSTNDTLDCVYAQLGTEYQWEAKTIQRYKEQEVSMMMEHLIPRQDVVMMYKEMVRQGKNILICTDTVYKRQHLQQIMNKYNIPEPKAMFLSSEMMLNKEQKEFWEKVYQDFEKTKTVHLGDDPRRDWHVLCEMGAPAILVFSPQDEFYLSDMYDRYVGQDISSVEESLSLGKKISETWFNSPFASLDEFED